MKKLLTAGTMVVATTLSLSSQAWIFGSNIQIIEAELDQILEPNFSLQPDQVSFAYNLGPISNWSSQKYEALSLFSGHRSVETLDLQTGAQGLEIYESQAAFVVNRPAAEISLKQLNAAEFIQSFDPDLKHSEVSPEQANLIYQETINERVDIRLQALENRLSRGTLSSAEYESSRQVLLAQAEINGQKQWCQSGADCIFSEAPFPFDWQLIIDAGKGLQQIDEDFPSQIEFFSEVVKGTPSELANRPEIELLVNRVAYPAVEVLIETSFVFNRFLQSGKTVISLHKISDNQTLVVLTTALAIEQDALTKYDMFNFTIRGVLLGNSLMNRDQGLAQGLPTYNTELATGLKLRLEEL